MPARTPDVHRRPRHLRPPRAPHRHRPARPRSPATDIVAGARNLDAISDLAATGLRTARIDYDEPDTVAAALSPGDTFVLISGAFSSDRTRQHADAITAAKRAGTGHILYVGA